MTQPPAGGQPPPWQVPGGDDAASPGDAGTQGGDPSGWGSPPAWGQQPGWGQGPQSGWGQGSQPGWGHGPPQAWTPQPAPPGIVPLRPLGVTEILDGAFQAVRSNPRTMIGTAAAVVAAVTLLSIVPQALVLGRLGDNPFFVQGSRASLRDQLDAVTGLLESQATGGVLTFVAVSVLGALLIVPVSGAVLGRRVGPAEMWQRARGRLLRAVALAVLTTVAVLAAVAVLLVPGVVALATGSPDLGVVLLLAGLGGAVVVALLLTVRWSLAAPALVLEKAAVTQSLRRSWRLTRGSFWRVLGVLLLAGIIVAIGQAAIAVPVGALAGLPAAGQASPYGNLPTTLASLLITAVGTIVSGAVFYPFNSAVSALLYIDLRMRREGLDVRLAQSAAQGGQVPGTGALPTGTGGPVPGGGQVQDGQLR